MSDHDRPTRERTGDGPDAHRPRRRFGQNFLHDQGIAERIVEAIAPDPAQRLVEIGPGLGAITAPLLAHAGSLDVIEIDRDLAGGLAERVGAGGELRIHVGDALDFDYATLGAGPHGLRVVGNLPYNISSPLLFHLLAQARLVDDMFFMLQREVVERLTAAPGTRAFGRLSVAVQVRCEANMLFTVGAGAFRPAPRVDSAIVHLRVHRAPPVSIHDQDRFDAMVTQLFTRRRKTLRNGLAGLLDQATIEALGIDPRRRPETLELEEFAALANALG